MVFRDLFSVMLTHWRLLPVWSPVLFCALRRFFSNRQPVLQQKRRPLPTGAMLPLKMNAFAHFVFKKDLIQQIRLNRTMCVRACQSFFCRTRCRKSQVKNAVLFQQTILRYFVHFGQHEKATRQSPAGSLCFIVLFPCYFRVLCVRFSLKYERAGAARPPPPSTRPAPCSHSARLKPFAGSCSSRFGFA